MIILTTLTNAKTAKPQEKFTGYCTDVFFEESIRFVEENKDNPFFLYISTNAPHSPYWVDEKWAGVYRDVVKWKHGAEFYGMISNLDYNLGLLRKKLKELKLSNDTILIFMTDNGTAKGGRERPNTQEFHGFNAGMRGQKSTIFEGGHRVPFLFTTQRAGFPVGMTASNWPPISISSLPLRKSVRYQPGILSLMVNPLCLSCRMKMPLPAGIMWWCNTTAVPG